jgi:hypothetical protein
MFPPGCGPVTLFGPNGGNIRFDTALRLDSNQERP